MYTRVKKLCKILFASTFSPGHCDQYCKYWQIFFCNSIMVYCLQPNICEIKIYGMYIYICKFVPITTQSSTLYGRSIYKKLTLIKTVAVCGSTTAIVGIALDYCLWLYVLQNQDLWDVSTGSLTLIYEDDPFARTWPPSR